MPTIMLLHTPPPEFIRSQIQQMVVDYVTDISLVAIAPSNPLYNLYQYGVGYEVHLYLNAMDGSQQLAVELIVALDDEDPETVLGFLLYLPVQDDPEACAVAYMAVRDSHRRQGIARSMLEKMTSRYPHAELYCVVGKVAYFEAMGFQVLGARGPQVIMNTRDHGTDGLLVVMDIAPIYNSVEVRQIHAYLLKQHGNSAMVDAEKQRDRHLDRMALEARTFAEQRLGNDGLADGVSQTLRLH
ncbi:MULTISPECIES: GNAT family N-acetyltransferase [Pseudomonas]|uniref:GCN5-related N-acetyltransferase n=3 Tax=Pseudomonas TaxID=286 RepID=A0A3M5WDF4_9PSED|nr:MULTISPECIES: GNAT family N-acetyltransferase [Pseudomonas]MCW6055667.1 GNAT family N-acetyltransferase [Pseudomonas fragi]KWS22376.1 GNAT family acetyltransferase [Pseudomonas syringae pv. syringae]MCH5487119.1 GNAT family N-acetyltransferase [Pseudomonas syringae pv. syringae]MDO1458274.1 GNAT family N-acetyltransferase [Pseudomonas syringae pv. syringae]MDV0425740.1 GNAT family N-acetyltransferase [Pseudomonas sp. 17]